MPGQLQVMILSRLEEADGHAAASLTLIMVAEVKARRMAAMNLRVAGVSVHEDRSAS